MKLSPLSKSAVERLPTGVPAPLFSATLALDRAMSVGASLAAVTSMVRLLAAAEKALPSLTLKLKLV